MKSMPPGTCCARASALGRARGSRHRADERGRSSTGPDACWYLCHLTLPHYDSTRIPHVRCVEPRRSRGAWCRPPRQLHRAVGVRRLRSCVPPHSRSCERYGSRKNGHLMRTLPAAPGSLEILEELDLRRNLVGKKGLRPVMDVVNACPNMTRLYLADNFLCNESLAEIATCLYGNQSLTYLDLSRNPISHPAGKVLGELADNTCVIKHIVLEGTFINPALQRSIDSRLQKNRSPVPSPGASVLDSLAASPPRDAASAVPTEDDGAALSVPPSAGTTPADADVALLPHRPSGDQRTARHRRSPPQGAPEAAPLHVTDGRWLAMLAALAPPDGAVCALDALAKR